MSNNPRFDGWLAYGAAQPASFDDTTLTTARSFNSVNLPAHCQIESIEVYMSTIAGGALDAIVTTWRDAAHEFALTGDGPAAATQTITPGATVSNGSVIWSVYKDHHPITTPAGAASVLTANDGTLPETQMVTIDVGVALNDGTATLTGLIVNWRA